MSNRVTEEYRHHTLLSAFHVGQYKGRVWKDKEMLMEITGESVQDVLSKLREFVDGRFLLIASSRKQPTDSAEYIKAFRNILSGLSDGQLAMLRAHYRAPNYRITATELADAAGYSTYGAANLQYGNLGKALFEEYPLDIDKYKDGSPIYTFMLATAGNCGVDEKEWIWEMRPEVISAIEALGLNK